ncbi:MAG TPA: IS1595 family transposase [Vitreimonas sp.]|uniref:IS1595 family transposase n=1 Tax=Vitreimonas sp. TaxID=3069702 RepID=UPI002D51385A|nr:IS1595 family transposase [Vitreimonas sp.]HYD88420.1 IS1595 family transposase [Vitreimonas sp.]
MNLQQPHFHDDDAARAYFEKVRWPEGRVCPHCGSIGSEYVTKRAGRYRCGAKECRKDFSTTTGTAMESSKIGLSKWLWTFYMMASSKKGISSLQVHRSLRVSKDAAWFMCHRVREAMKAGGLQAPLDGPGRVVSADETYHGNIPEAQKVYSKRRAGSTTKRGGRRGVGDKRAIVTLVERGGQSRSFHVATADAETVAKILRENVARESRLHTDSSAIYKKVGKEFAEHGAVDHSSGEYVRYENGDFISSNACEAYFSVFKRGMRGVYQLCSEKNLHRYLAEFDFRHNTRERLGIDDKERADRMLAGAEGKRLTYRRTNRSEQHAR